MNDNTVRIPYGQSRHRIVNLCDRQSPDDLYRRTFIAVDVGEYQTIFEAETDAGAVCLPSASMAIKWYPLDELKAIPGNLIPLTEYIRRADNREADKAIAEGRTQRMDERWSYDYSLHRQIEAALSEPLVIELTPDMAANVQATAHVNVRIVPTLFHKTMVESEAAA